MDQSPSQVDWYVLEKFRVITFFHLRRSLDRDLVQVARPFFSALLFNRSQLISAIVAPSYGVYILYRNSAVNNQCILH